MKANHLGGSISICVIALASAQVALAYPEFQQFIQRNSGRNVNCAMCHVNSDGPEGLKPGQIGSLTREEMDRLNKARAAFEPGQRVDSPILNTFGNHIMETVGKNRFLQLRLDPAGLAEALGRESDLDDDGICDADEYLEGTHPLDAHHGSPWRLFKTNARRYAFHIAMMVLATAAGVYGLNNLLRAFDAAAHARAGGQTAGREWSGARGNRGG